MAYWLWQSPERRDPELWPLLQGILMEFVQTIGHLDTSISECRVSLLPPDRGECIIPGTECIIPGTESIIPGTESFIPGAEVC